MPKIVALVHQITYFAKTATIEKSMNHLRLLNYVDAVARVGSIRQAAEQLHVAASAVNRRIQDIEEELGTPIFERMPRGMRLTTAGELFIKYIRDRSSDLDQVRSQIEELKGLRRGTVRIVASQALAPSFLPRFISSFRKSHPLVAFQVTVGDHLQALKMLRNFETDLALVFNLSDEPDITRICELEQRLMCLMNKTHPLARKQVDLKLRDCADYPIVLPAPDLGGRQLLDRFLLRSSIKLKPIIESNSFEFLRGCLQYDQALTFQIAIGAVTDSSQVVARHIVDRGFPSGRLVLANLRSRQLPLIASAFSEAFMNSHLENAVANA
jgi:DNA-binding transcriptional LysR family regulator